MTVDPHHRHGSRLDMPTGPDAFAAPRPAPRPIPVSPIGLVAIDIDGTTLRSDKRLGIRVLRAVLRCQQQGVKVVIATARPPRSVRPVYKALQLDTLQVNCNGALVLNPVTGDIVSHTPLQPALMQKAVEVARRIDPEMTVHLEVVDQWFAERVSDQTVADSSRRYRPDYVGPLDVAMQSPATKLTLNTTRSNMRAMVDAIGGQFGADVQMSSSEGRMLQLINRQADKQHGVADVAAYYDVARENVMAIGDAPNDEGMLRWAGLGVAMANAWDQTLRAADVVAPANDDDGLAFALRRYVINTLAAESAPISLIG